MASAEDSMKGKRGLESEPPVHGRYELRRQAAQGEIYDVYVARHLVTEATVALKMLRTAVRSDPGAHARLFREARILGSFRHPSLVAAYDAGQCPIHGPFLVLEMVEGRRLDGILLARRTLSVTQTVALGVELSHALSYVHRRGFVHADIRPANILISDTPVGDRIEIIDFGAARKIEEDDGQAAAPPLRAGGSASANAYRPPELLATSTIVDPRSDIYSVAAILYESLTGVVPHAERPLSVRASGSLSAPTSIRELRADVPAALDELICRALSASRYVRPESFDTFAAECRALAGGVIEPLRLLEAAGVTLRPGSPQTPPSPEQSGRRYARAPYITPVRLRLPDGSPVDGRTEDISERGALVVLDAECAAHQEVELRLPLPSSGRIAPLRATTRWVRESRGKRAIGVEFLEPPDAVVTAIRHYVELMAIERPNGQKPD